jgi:DNA-binding NtrC family response regulator
MPRGQILIVDDEPAILSTLKKALSLEGYAVEVAGRVAVAEEKAQAALLRRRAARRLRPRRRRRDPARAAARGRQRGAGDHDERTRDHRRRRPRHRLGALDFLEKPINSDRLLLVLENTIRLPAAEEEARELRAEAGHLEELVGTSAAMRELGEQITRAARAQASVLVTGERGTGKELVARAIHRASPRAKGPLEKLNCAAVPKELIESELFGHEAGAFTGATRQRRGKFERAHGGTLFLDEVGDMPLDMQAKLLRVLQEREIERVGGNETLRVDVRVVAATNRDLKAACADGTFRADLYDRLNVVPLALPPLRARRDDIPALAAHFLEAAARSNARPAVRLAPEALAALRAHSYPGNVRELRNLIERLVILSPDDLITAAEVERALGMGGPRPRWGCSGLAFRSGCSRRGGADHHRGSARGSRRADGRHGAGPRPRAEPPLQEGEGARAPWLQRGARGGLSRPRGRGRAGPGDAVGTGGAGAPAHARDGARHSHEEAATQARFTSRATRRREVVWRGLSVRATFDNPWSGVITPSVSVIGRSFASKVPPATDRPRPAGGSDPPAERAPRSRLAVAAIARASSRKVSMLPSNVPRATTPQRSGVCCERPRTSSLGLEPATWGTAEKGLPTFSDSSSAGPGHGLPSVAMKRRRAVPDARSYSPSPPPIGVGNPDARARAQGVLDLEPLAGGRLSSGRGL